MVNIRRAAVIAAVVIAAALVTVVVVHKSAGGDSRQRQDMLLPSLRGPQNWSDTKAHDYAISRSVSRSWNRGPDDFTEVVYGFTSESAAKRDFRSSSPEKVTRDAYPNASPYDIGARAGSADQAQFTCGEREQDECVTWWAWLRFNDVNITLRYRHDPTDAHALSDTQLATMVNNAITDLSTLAH
ncbi:hypothetical protein ABZ901_15965 [Actinacidiphila alni]|uniref:hypothetical protein n=1 Tax=Actinacidiphila alni TaxID=380248 RepID=UPI00340DD5B4